MHRQIAPRLQNPEVLLRKLGILERVLGTIFSNVRRSGCGLVARLGVEEGGMSAVGRSVAAVRAGPISVHVRQVWVGLRI